MRVPVTLCLVLLIGCRGAPDAPTFNDVSGGSSRAFAAAATGLTISTHALHLTPGDTATVSCAPACTWQLRQSPAATITVTSKTAARVNGGAVGATWLLAKANPLRDSLRITVALDTVPTDTVPPPPPSCLDGAGPTVRLTGAQPKYDHRTGLTSGTRYDLTGATWDGFVGFPFLLGNGQTADLCVHGGSFTGPYTTGTSWSTYHSSAGMFMGGPGIVIEDATVSNYGDAIRIEDSTDNFTIRRMHVVGAHDDCIENDRIYGGLVDDSYFEGCYVVLSERPGSGVNISLVGATSRTVEIRNTLVWHKPQPTVYAGVAPGTGPTWKWSDSTGTQVVLNGLTLREDQIPSHGNQNAPPRMSCAPGSTNIVVWFGSGAFTGVYPPCVTVTTDQSVWDRAVATWHAAHP